MARWVSPARGRPWIPIRSTKLKPKGDIALDWARAGRKAIGADRGRGPTYPDVLNDLEYRKVGTAPAFAQGYGGHAAGPSAVAWRGSCAGPIRKPDGAPRVSSKVPAQRDDGGRLRPTSGQMALKSVSQKTLILNRLSDDLVINQKGTRAVGKTPHRTGTNRLPQSLGARHGTGLRLQRIEL